jgi:argininosuccinate lyase
VNKLVLAGMPFRDAYRKVGADIESGNFKPDKGLAHVHVGSIGNLSNHRITKYFRETMSSFNFEKVSEAIDALVNGKS